MTTTNNKNSTSRKLHEILEEGTPRQKALLVCKNYLEPYTLSLYGGKATLSDEDVSIIQKTLSDEEIAIYNKWIRIYNTYTNMLQTVGLAMAEYMRNAKSLVGYINLWDAYDSEADLLNSLYLSIKETGSKEAVATFEKTLEEERDSLRWGEIIKDKDGYYSVDSTRLKEIIKASQKNVITAYSVVKALVIVLERFINKTKSHSFVPDILKSTLSDAKKDYLVYNISSRYSCRELRKRKERGEKITKYDEERALFPDYETLKVNPEHVEHFEIVLNNRYNP